MKRKLFSALLILALLLSVAVTAYATDPDAPRVVDNAGLLTPDELAELTEQIYDQRNALGLEIVIVTTYGTDGKSVQAYADDFYDRNGYGYGSNDTGILLIVDMESREWYMSTCGDAIDIFPGYALDALGEGMLPYLSDGDYFGSFTHWVADLAYYAESYHRGEIIDGYVQPEKYNSLYGDDTIYYYADSVGIRIHPFPIALVIGLVAAAIAVLVMRSKMNTAKFRSDAVDYLLSGSFALRQRADVFLYSRISRTPRPKNNTSHGSGSSVHRSSGGVRHGGRGGRF